ncbi:MAG: T9SS type A sorting domain-containing protein, partial [Bacteroidota bacterium]
SNSTSAFDLNGESDDWVELYNTTSNAIDLSGMYLSDDPTNYMKWAFPFGTTIPANGYILVWCDNDMGQAGIHTNFKLSSLGENLIFSNGATIYDQVAFGVQTADVAYARCPNGSADFANVTPTPLASNNCQAGIEEFNSNLDVLVYPNPAIEKITIVSEESTEFQLIITDVQGRIVLNESLGMGTHEFSISDWSNGIFYVNFSQENGLKLTKTLVKI